MSQSIAILGRQPAIGLAELESLYGAEAIQPISNQAAIIKAETIDFGRLGGSMKLAKLLTVLDFTQWDKIEAYLAEELPKHTCCITEGKLTLGLSLYNFKINPKKINATALSLKKIIKATDRPARIVPNKSSELSSAQVLHNKLFTSHNWELLLLKDGDKTYLARTTDVQDIDAYSARDQARPMRDARVGMLPPKLAQTIINLCNPQPNSLIFDPFCGTGVLLQEALLMNQTIGGSDIDPRMVNYTQKNLSWLSTTHGLNLNEADLTKLIQAADATNFQLPDSAPYEMHIACETYLGRPFSSTPESQTLRKVMTDVDTIHEKFLKNVASQTKPGFTMCIAVPAWRIGSQFKHLKTLDSLEKLGYTRVSFVHADNKDLIYHREGQIVGRELVVLERK